MGLCDAPRVMWAHSRCGQGGPIFVASDRLGVMIQDYEGELTSAEVSARPGRPFLTCSNALPASVSGTRSPLGRLRTVFSTSSRRSDSACLSGRKVVHA